METYLLCLAAALVGGLMLTRVTKLLHLPAVTAYLVAGLLLGPFCIGALGLPGLGFNSLEQVEALQVLTKVYIPMSKSTIATVALFFAISRWNGYYWARQMITNSNEHPLQVFIRLKLEEYTDPEIIAGWNETYASDSMIYALVVCSIVPILIIYPFIQKYFAKGVNMGGVKE